MKKILVNPLRVYLIVAVLAVIGLYCGWSLPISLFPQASRPVLALRIGYGSMSPDDFRERYGERMESGVRSIRRKDIAVENILSRYKLTEFTMNITFNWGADPDTAMKEAQAAIDSIASSLPQEIRRSMELVGLKEDTFAMMLVFSSEKRSLDEVYRIIQPRIVPKIMNINEVESAKLMNPSEKEILLTLKPGNLLQLGLKAQTIQTQIESALAGQSAGRMLTESNSWALSKSASVVNTQELARLPIPLKNGGTVLLSEVATITSRTSSASNEMTKIDGQRSLALLIYPKQGGNMKALSDQALAIMEEVQRSLPPDIAYRVVIDKADNVKASIASVAAEVLFGSLLATLVLYFFIGSGRNVLTASLEIPMSMILAFILMKAFHVTINLFSLSGLALASGMNVDASVVVMENIIRHLELRRKSQDPGPLLDCIVTAVNEVKWPVVISTVASLVVFIPFLAMEGLAQALLGDLVKAIIFSHGLSAVVALILVPTIRYNFNAREKSDHSGTPKAQAPLLWLQERYLLLIQMLLRRRTFSRFLLGFFCFGLLAFCLWVAQRLPQEIVGRPDSDWIYVSFSTEGNTQIQELEGDLEPFLRLIRDEVGAQALTNATILNDPDSATALIQIKDTGRMDAIVSALKGKLTNQSRVKIQIETWNQSEFSLTVRPAFRIIITGGDADERTFAATDLAQKIAVLGKFETVEARPSLATKERIDFSPRTEVFSKLDSDELSSSSFELLDDLRLIGEGRWIGDMTLEQIKTPVMMRYPESYADSFAKLRGLPVRVGDLVVPLQSLFEIKRVPPNQWLQKENGLPFTTVVGYFPGTKQDLSDTLKQDLERISASYEGERRDRNLPSLAFNMREADPDRSLALRQLSWALGVSGILLFLTIFLHFGHLFDSLLVMLAVPFAIFGALLSLWLFGSTLSLNSLLGMTLLCGISVNNSIMLVDFMRISERDGCSAHESMRRAIRARLRPILITSLTTILGMQPLALGFGEGGKILSPLGISVAGGLVVSTSLTLIFVPLLHGLRHERPRAC